MQEQGKENTDGKFNPKSWHPIISICLGSLLGSGGSLGVLYATPLGQNITRPNAFTSIDFSVEQARIDGRLTVLESHVGEDHPDRRGDFDTRITENRMQIGLMNIHLNNMLSAVGKNSDKLDKLLERK